MIGDTHSSILQAYGNYTHASNVSGAVDSSQYLTDHHMAFLSFLFGLIVKTGEKIIDANFGYFLLCFSVMCLQNFAKAYTVSFLSKYRYGGRAVLALTAIYFFTPSLLMWSICPVKDNVFMPLLMFYIVLILDIIRDREKIKSFKFWIPFTLLSLLIPFTKHQGIYAVILTSIILLIVFRKYWYGFASVIVSTVLVVNVLVMGVIYPALGVLPSGKQEAYGVLFQQTGRYVYEYPDEVTEEEKQVIDNVLIYDKIQSKYRWRKQDSVKFLYRDIVQPGNENGGKGTVKDADMKNYMRVWFEMFLKHPSTYFKATTDCVYGFFYQDLSENRGGSKICSFGISDKWNKYGKELSFHTNKKFENLQKKVEKIVKVGYKNSFTRALFANFSVNWIFMVLVCACIYKKKWKDLLAMTPIHLCFLMLLISPCVTYRYVMPMAYAVPLMIVLL
ncbi:MAG: DUF6020 family protein, partial [Acutalibacteraceae bacterium]